MLKFRLNDEPSKSIHDWAENDRIEAESDLDRAITKLGAARVIEVALKRAESIRSAAAAGLAGADAELEKARTAASKLVSGPASKTAK